MFTLKIISTWDYIYNQTQVSKYNFDLEIFNPQQFLHPYFGHGLNDQVSIPNRDRDILLPSVIILSLVPLSFLHNRNKKQNSQSIMLTSHLHISNRSKIFNVLHTFNKVEFILQTHTTGYYFIHVPILSLKSVYYIKYFKQYNCPLYISVITNGSAMINNPLLKW